jgi:hypothetical protein
MRAALPSALVAVAIFFLCASAYASGCNVAVTEPIRFAKGAQCWYYAGKATHFRGIFLAGQHVTVEMHGEAWSVVGEGMLAKPEWQARLPSIEGPHKFFAMPETVLDEPTGRLEATLPESGQYTFGFSPCAMWNGYGHVAICTVLPR